MRARWPLTLRGTGAAVLAVVCLVLAQHLGLAELLYLAILLVALLAASVVAVFLTRPAHTVTRAFDPDVVAVGGEVSVRVRLGVRALLPSAQERWTETLPDGLDGDGPQGEAAGSVPAPARRGGDGGVSLAYTATARRRGIHAVGPLSILTTDPFGLVRRRRRVGGSSPLTVTPALVELGPLRDQPGEAGGGTRVADDRLGQGADNLIPRHYTPGDSMRRIHWRASAHRDQLMVRQEEQETTPAAIVVLDRGAAHWSMDATRSPGADPGFETAVSACASIVSHLVREGYTVEVVDGDGGLLSDPLEAGDVTGVEQLTIELAGLRAVRTGGLAGILSALGGGATGPLVVIAGALRTEDADLLRPVAARSALPVLISVCSPVEAARDGALARVASAGWRTAVAAEPDDLAAAWSEAVDRGERRVGV